MITDHYLETYNDILSNLNKLGVPGNGLSWNRINEYAKDYLKYTSLDIELDSLFIKLTNDQEKAWNKILNWLKSSDNYFVLRGYAGSGKSFLLKKLKELDITVYYTAPTNKATKVLSRFTQRECHTIYSLLGIRMSQDDDKLVLTYSDDPPYIPKNSVIVIDECFVKNTLVDTPTGPKPIIDIKKGDKILNACGIDVVEGTNVKTVEKLVKICFSSKYQKKEIFSSENHKFFTQRGYVVARELRPDDTLISTKEAMRLLQQNNFGRTESRLAKVLRSELRDDLAPAIPRIEEKNIQRKATSKLRFSKKEVVKFWASKSIERNRKNPKIKSYGKHKNEKESQQKTKRNRSSSTYSRWEWSRINQNTKIPIKSITEVIRSRICNSYGFRSWYRYSISLYRGYSKFEKENSHRMRWPFPQGNKEEKKRQNTRQNFKRARVDSITILESSDRELDAFRDPEGNICLYDLKARRHPSFSVEGYLVHNCSMISEGLLSFIKKTVKRTKCKVLFVGDPAQLPPVGETRTKAWSVTNLKENHAFLKKVVRYDNQLLSLATEIRENIKTKNYYSPIKDDNQKDEGVFLLPKSKFMNLLEMYNKPEDFIDRKVIAWKNVTVNHYNNSIRENLGFNWPFEKNDILLIAEPVEQNGQIVSTIDDEYIVQSVDKSSIKVYKNKEEQPYIKVWSLIVQDDSGTQLTLSIPIDKGQLHEVLTYRANLAKNAENSNDRRSLWREFWAIKRTFHSVRYGYALTAHRAQGSTYTSCFIDQRDIMSNTNKKEALRCLYVAATRPTTSLFTF